MEKGCFRNADSLININAPLLDAKYKPQTFIRAEQIKIENAPDSLENKMTDIIKNNMYKVRGFGEAVEENIGKKKI